MVMFLLKTARVGEGARAGERRTGERNKGEHVGFYALVHHVRLVAHAANCLLRGSHLHGRGRGDLARHRTDELAEH